jgi:hypothetical protein
VGEPCRWIPNRCLYSYVKVQYVHEQRFKGVSKQVVDLFLRVGQRSFTGSLKPFPSSHPCHGCESYHLASIYWLLMHHFPATAPRFSTFPSDERRPFLERINNAVDEENPFDVSTKNAISQLIRVAISLSIPLSRRSLMLFLM